MVPDSRKGRLGEQSNSRVWVWISGLWFFPIAAGCYAVLPRSDAITFALLSVAVLASPIPALALGVRQQRRIACSAAAAEQEADSLKRQLATVGNRVGRLREELSAANRQARLSHQLTLLGQFTAGFLHEYNNPLAIVTNRIEVLLDERKEDSPLCADLEQMLAETRYMSRIGGTLLRALRRERGAEAFEPCVPADILSQAAAAMAPAAQAEGVEVVVEPAETPRVDVPAHSMNEVVRGLISNSVAALRGKDDARIWLRLEPYRSPGANVVMRVDDNGPGVPEAIRDRLFEPFTSQSAGRERLGLGLFLAASLLNAYDGALRYEPRPEGGASFVVEVPAARFTHDQPFHWFIKGGGT